MRKSAAMLLAAMAFVPAIGALTAPASAQTQGQTYAIGPSDFYPSYAQTRRAERMWRSDPAAYDYEYAYQRPSRSRVIDCSRMAAAEDPRCF